MDALAETALMQIKRETMKSRCVNALMLRSQTHQPNACAKAYAAAAASPPTRSVCPADLALLMPVK